MLAGCGLGEALSSGDGQSTWVDLTPVTLVGLWRSDRGDMIEFTADGEFFGDDVTTIADGWAAVGLASFRFQHSPPRIRDDA